MHKNKIKIEEEFERLPCPHTCEFLQHSNCLLFMHCEKRWIDGEPRCVKHPLCVVPDNQ